MDMIAGRFSGRTAVVTGGASGLGLLAAQRIVQEGGRVSLWDLNDSALAEAQTKIGGAHTVSVNIGNHNDVVEAARGAPPQQPGPGWELVREKVLGEVRMALLKNLGG